MCVKVWELNMPGIGRYAILTRQNTLLKPHEKGPEAFASGPLPLGMRFFAQMAVVW